MSWFNPQPYFTSEVSSNHYQDINRCFEFIDVSSEIGCAAVKFQLFKARELFSPEVFRARPEVKEREKWELPVSFLPDLSARCKEKNIHFSMTPFYLKAVEELEPYVDFYKVASYELLWHDLLKECAATGKPLVISTGMAEMDEIKAAVDVIMEAGCQELLVLHCTSAYPTPPEECNLAAIKTLRDALGCDIGWSDHSRTPGVIHRAIDHWGAKFVEFHLDLDGQGAEYKTGHCWLPDEIGAVIKSTSLGLNADGDGHKAPVASELPDRVWRADPTDGLRPLKSIRNNLSD